MASAWTLQITDPEGEAYDVPLDGDEFVIGRSANADVRLDRPSVSRRHARLFREKSGAWWVVDLQSRAGLTVNGKAADRAAIAAGDAVEISRFRLVLGDGEEPPARVPDLGTVDWRPGGEDASDIDVLTRGVPPKLDMGQITALHAFGKELIQRPDAGERLARLCEVVCGDQVRGKWAMALRLDADDPSRPPKRLAVYPEDEGERGDVRLSRTTIHAMQESGSPVLASNFGSADQVVEMSAVIEAPTAAAACPLSDEPGSDDLIYVSLPPKLGTAEWLALVALAVKQYQQAEAAWAARAAIERRAALDRDLANARKIQQSILPGREPPPGLDLAWWYEPCDEVGGDYVDVVDLPDGRVVAIIADATGHGLPAALAAMTAHGVLRTCLKAGLDLPAAVTSLNDHLVRYLPSGRFLTLLAAAIDPATGELTLVNGGHHAALAVRADGAHREVGDAEHFPLGVAETTFEGATDRLAPDEWLVLTTDGVTELTLEGGEWLGNARVAEMTATLLADRDAHGATAVALAAGLRERLGGLTDRLSAHDDVTLLTMRRA